MAGGWLKGGWGLLGWIGGGCKRGGGGGGISALEKAYRPLLPLRLSKPFLLLGPSWFLSLEAVCVLRNRCSRLEEMIEVRCPYLRPDFCL